MGIIVTLSRVCGKKWPCHLIVKKTALGTHKRKLRDSSENLGSWSPAQSSGHIRVSTQRPTFESECRPISQEQLPAIMVIWIFWFTEHRRASQHSWIQVMAMNWNGRFDVGKETRFGGMRKQQRPAWEEQVKASHVTHPSLDRVDM